MPVVHDVSTYRPPKEHAKRPTARQKLRLLETDAATDRDYPLPPWALNKKPVARAHFRHLVRQLHPDDFDNPILLDYITQAAAVWDKIQAILTGLLNGSIPEIGKNSTGQPAKAPEFSTLSAYQALYQNMLASAGLKGGNKLSEAAKIRAKAARTPKKAVSAAAPTREQAMASLLARPKEE